MAKTEAALVPLDLQVGGQKLTLIMGDLVDGSVTRFTNGTISVVSEALKAALAQPISALPTPIQAPITVDKLLSWTKALEKGSLSINIHPEVDGQLIVQRTGEVFRYTESEKDDDEQHRHVVTVPQGKAYVSLVFHVSLQATGALGFSQGEFGVKASIGTENKFLLAYHCCVDDAVTIEKAITTAFAQFVLPFDHENVGKLKDLDYLQYEFYGKLAFDLNATAGFKGVFFGGISGGELQKSLNSVVGSVTAKAAPAFSLGAEFGVTYTHEDAYRIVVTKQQRLHLFIFKMDTNKLSHTLTLSAGVKPQTSIDIAPKLDDIIQKAVEKALPQNVPTRDDLIKALVLQVKKNTSEVDKYVAQANDEANGFLQKLDKLNVTATFGHERISEHTLLMSYDFDIPAQVNALQLALAGDFQGAVAAGAELGTESFVRQSLSDRTSVGIQFFGSFSATTVTEYLENSDVSYAGNGIFQLRFTSELKASGNIFGHTKAIDMYFTASAKTDGTALTEKDLQFVITTQEQNNTRAAVQTAGALEHLLPETNSGAALRAAVTAHRDLTVKVICTFPVTTLRRLSFTAYEAGNKPPALPHTLDVANYIAFVDAVDLLFDHAGFAAQGFPNLVDKFSQWAHYNIWSSNNGDDGTRPPNRRNDLHPDVDAVWPNDPTFPARSLSSPERFVVRSYLQAAQAFMNLCEDLRTLARGIDDANTKTAFEAVLAGCDHFLAKDQSGEPLQFTKPVLLALVRRMGAQPETVDAPTSAPDKEFVTTITFR